MTVTCQPAEQLINDFYRKASACYRVTANNEQDRFQMQYYSQHFRILLFDVLISIKTAEKLFIQSNFYMPENGINPNALNL